MTILEKLHEIEKVKVIYNIVYRRAGVGIIFYYPEKVNKNITRKYKMPNGKMIDLKYFADWQEGLSVEKYYSTFEEAIEAEYNKLKEKL